MDGTNMKCLKYISAISALTILGACDAATRQDSMSPSEIKPITPAPSFSLSKESQVVSDKIQYALENIPSGEKYTWMHSSTLIGFVEPQKTFLLVNGKICRQYSAQIKQEYKISEITGTLCRSKSDQEWTLEPVEN